MLETLADKNAFAETEPVAQWLELETCLLLAHAWQCRRTVSDSKSIKEWGQF